MSLIRAWKTNTPPGTVASTWAGFYPKWDCFLPLSFPQWHFFPSTGWGTTKLVWGPTPHSCFFSLFSLCSCDAINRNQLQYLWRRLVPDKTLDLSLLLKVFIKITRLQRFSRCSEEQWGFYSCYGSRAVPQLRLLLAQQQGKTMLRCGCRAGFST